MFVMMSLNSIMASGRSFILEANQFTNSRMNWVASMCELLGAKFRFNVLETLNGFQGQLLILDGSKSFSLSHMRRVFFMFDVTMDDEFNRSWNCEITGQRN